jgi:hypothetical protein
MSKTFSIDDPLPKVFSLNFGKPAQAKKSAPSVVASSTVGGTNENDANQEPEYVTGISAEGIQR